MTDLVSISVERVLKQKAVRFSTGGKNGKCVFQRKIAPMRTKPVFPDFPLVGKRPNINPLSLILYTQTLFPHRLRAAAP
jgi:hypothetical protein